MVLTKVPYLHPMGRLYTLAIDCIYWDNARGQFFFEYFKSGTASMLCRSFLLYLICFLKNAICEFLQRICLCNYKKAHYQKLKRW